MIDFLPEESDRLSLRAVLFLATNRLVEAEPPRRCALTIDEKSRGPDHPKVDPRAIDLKLD